MKIIITIIILLISTQALCEAVEVELKLSPAGSFTAKCNTISGKIQKNSDGKIMAENMRMNVSCLKTGIGLRDQHMKEKYLEVNNYPEIVLSQAMGQNEIGKGTFLIKDKKIEVSGKYTEDGKKIKAEFPISLSQIGIDKIKYMGVGVKDEAIVKVEAPLHQ